MKLKYRVIERFRGTYTVEEMCRVFQVSRSGYYAWRARQNEAPKDQWLIDLVIECQQKCNQTYGCRRVKRWLPYNHPSFDTKLGWLFLYRKLRKMQKRDKLEGENRTA